MAKIESSACPKCGGPLQVRVGMMEIRCEYCGTLSQVHQGKEPAAVTPPAGESPMVVYVPSSRGARLPVIMLGVALLVAAGITLAVVFKSSSGVTSVLEGDGSFEGTPMLADVNGDGVPDVIGHAEWDDQAYIAAFEGATGKVLWRTAASKESLKGAQAIVGGVFIAVDELGKVQATRISNGTPAWAGLLSDNADTFCADGNAAVIEARDKTVMRFDLATGQKSDLAGRRPASCAPVYQTTSANPTTPHYTLIRWSDFAAHGLPELNTTPGMAAHRALVPTPTGTNNAGLSFLLGSKDQGTQVAMVAAVENGKILWKSTVPGIDPLRSAVNVTTIIAAANGARVVIPYEVRDRGGERMACFEARTGNRIWDVEVHKASSVDFGVTIESGRVYYASWTALYVLSLHDGKLLYRLGHEF